MRRLIGTGLVGGILAMVAVGCGSDNRGEWFDGTVPGDGATDNDGGMSDGGPGDDAAQPVDCSPLAAHAGWSLCESGPDYCAAVFEDGAGCDVVCAAVGMVCGATHEDLDGQCAPDTSRPELSCTNPSGHQSDYCLCVTGTCVPDCAGNVCGPDGCGSACGPGCDPGDSCVAGACQGGPVEDCTSYPFQSATLLAERQGFGAQAAGGDPSQVYHVTTLDDGGAGSLRDALESSTPWWIVFDVNGLITHNTHVDVQSNKTVDGRGRDITVEGELRLQDARDVILSDIHVTNELEGHCTQAGDVILVRGTSGPTPSDYTSRDIWFHHVEAYLGGDGLLDLRGASNITISWTHFHGHKKGLLMWQDQNGDPTPGMRVTFHHNFFDRISLRGPQFIYGWCHYFNNYQFEWYEYGAGSLGGAQFFSEANIYEARPGTVCLPACPDPNPCGDSDYLVSKEALVVDWGGNGIGNAISLGDLALNGAVIHENQPGTVFDPAVEYAYTAETATAGLAATIAAESGPRINYCNP